MMTTKRTVAIKVKISFLSVKNEKEWNSILKYQIPNESKNDTIINRIGKIRQQSLFFMNVPDNLKVNFR